jgi:hypothetical protein
MRFTTSDPFARPAFAKASANQAAEAKILSLPGAPAMPFRFARPGMLSLMNHFRVDRV